MIDMILIAAADNTTPVVIEKRETALQQSGLIHSKVAGRFEVVKELPKVADSFDGMFDYADAFGKLRLAYIDSAHKISNEPKETKNATAFGGEFGFNTASFYDFSFHLSAYVSQGINSLNPSHDERNEDFYDVNGKSFIYIAEASLDYNSEYFQTRLGRVRVDTPYANSDDIRMAPNTFEGAWANIDYTPTLKTQLLYFNKWAGYDSQDEHEDVLESQHEFKNLVDDDSFGMVGASLTYEYAKNSEASFWYNYIDSMAAIAYAEVVGIYFIDGENIHMDYGVQVSNISELDDSNVDGNVLGAMAIMHYKGAFLGGAYNISYSDEGKYVTNGFGGGPYYTSLDEATISAISEGASGLSASNNNAEAFRIGGGYEFENIGLDGLVVELVYGELYNDNGKIKEKDAILTYEVGERWYLEAIFTNYWSSCDNNTFDRALVRLDYNF